jgi:hypothetical protein
MTHMRRIPVKRVVELHGVLLLHEWRGNRGRRFLSSARLPRRTHIRQVDACQGPLSEPAEAPRGVANLKNGLFPGHRAATAPPLGQAAVDRSPSRSCGTFRMLCRLQLGALRHDAMASKSPECDQQLTSQSCDKDAGVTVRRNHRREH